MTDAWLTAAAAGRPFEAVGPWGAARGTLAAPPAVARRRWFFGGARSQANTAMAVVVPNITGIEHAARIGVMEDALCAGLLRAGAHVARLHHFTLHEPPFDDATAYVNAVHDIACAAAALEPDVRVALAGVWLAGAAAAAASVQRADLAFLTLVAAPAPEIMSRRTPEDEDSPEWGTSPSLRLADALAGVAPLERIQEHRRPVLLVNGAVDDELPSAHMAAWRNALAEVGAPVDAVEIAFADAAMTWRDAEGAPAEEPAGGAARIEELPQACETLAQVVSRWAIRALRAR